MKKLLQHVKTGKIELLDVPVPEFKPNFVLVKTAYSAISLGTELTLVNLLKSSLLQKARKRPDVVKKVISMTKRYGVKTTYHLINDRLDSLMPLGYSLAGEVIMADEESEFSKGDMVACGGSEYASHQEIALVPVNMCVKIPPGVGLKEASFSTIGSVAIWALREAGIEFGERGLVVGLGLLGILSCRIMQSAGVDTTGVDIDSEKVDFANNIGVSAAKLMDLKEENFDFVIVTASSTDPSPVEYAIEKSRRRGRIVIVGTMPIKLDRNKLYEKEVKVSVSRSYGPGRYDPYYELLGYTCPPEYLRWNVRENMRTFLNLIKRGKLSIEDIITHEFPFEEAHLAYEKLKNEKAIGAIFIYSNKQAYQSKKVSINSQKVEGKIKVDVIGAGTYLRNFILPFFKKNRNVVLCTVCNERPESGYSAAKTLGFSSYTTSSDEIFEGDADLVIIGTRHDTHGTFVKRALLKGKAVYVEKPLTINLNEVYEIKEILQDRGGFLHVGFNRRFSRGFIEMRKHLKGQMPVTGFIRIIAGKLSSTHWAKIPDIGGDRIVGEVCHFVDAAVFLTESPVKSVFARSIKESSRFDDNLHILLKMENGSLITIMYTEWGSDQIGKEYYEMHGDGISIQMYDFKKMFVRSKKNVSIRLDGKGHENEVRSIINGLENGKTPITFDEILNVTFTTFAIRKSLREGREVFIKEFQRD